MKALLLLLASIGILMAQDAPPPDPNTPVSFPEIQNLYDALRVPWLLDQSKSSTFSIAKLFEQLQGPYEHPSGFGPNAVMVTAASSPEEWKAEHAWRDNWKDTEKWTASLLARPEGRETPILKELAELERRIDRRQDDGFYDFMVQLDQDYHFPAQ